EHHQYGEAEILVRFDFEGQQEDDIKRHYGERGQKLDGPFVYKHEHFGDVFQKAEVSVTYDPDEPSDLVFKQPNWHISLMIMVIHEYGLKLKIFQMMGNFSIFTE